MADRALVDLRGGYAGGDDRFDGVDDLGPAAVVEGDRKRHGPVVRSEGDGLVHAPDNPAGHPPVAPADEPDTNSPPVQVVAPPGQQLVGDDAQQEADFLVWAPPVLGGKGVHGEVLDPHLQGPARRVEQGFLSRPMPLGSRQTLLRRPAPVAIHHARHVPGQPVGI